MYEIGYSGGLKTRRTNRAEIPSPIGTQLKYDIDRKQDVTIEAENDGDMVVTFAPYHAIEAADYTISVRAAEDPVDANCPEEKSGTVLFDGVVTITGDDPVPIVLESPFVLGAAITVTLNGEIFSGTVESPSEGVIGVKADFGEYNAQVVTVSDQGSFFAATGPPAVIGENSVKIVQTD